MRNTSRIFQTVLILAGTFLLAGTSGCSVLNSFQRPTADITGVSLKEVGLSSATLMFDVKITNPYTVAIPLTNLDYCLASRESQFLAGKAQMQGSIPAQASTTVAIPTRVVYADLLKVLKSIRPGAVIPYSADIGLSVNAPGVGEVRLPLHKEGQLPIPAVPTVDVADIHWDKLSWDEIRGTVKITLGNVNDFPVDMTQLRYAFSLGGVEVANASIARPVSFQAGGGRGELELPLVVVPANAGLGVFNMLRGSGAVYGFQGSLSVSTPYGPIEMPLDKRGNVLFHKK